MANETGTKQPPRANDESLQSPHPPGQLTEDKPEVQDDVNDTGQTEDEDATNTTEDASSISGAEKVQDYDWNNGKPEVTPEQVETLPTHKTPEVENDETLRENKGEKPGEHPLEASEEVNTGQNAG